eukprot:1866187-Prymnesium_polylepis.1
MGALHNMRARAASSPTRPGCFRSAMMSPWTAMGVGGRIGALDPPEALSVAGGRLLGARLLEQSGGGPRLPDRQPQHRAENAVVPAAKAARRVAAQLVRDRRDAAVLPHDEHGAACVLRRRPRRQ